MNRLDERVRVLATEMRDAIDSFQANRLPIDRLSWELKSRITALDEIADSEWVDELESVRNALEVISAVYIESGRSTLGEEERQEALDVLGELRAALILY
jgi:hypothetical protein